MYRGVASEVRESRWFVGLREKKRHIDYTRVGLDGDTRSKYRLYHKLCKKQILSLGEVCEIEDGNNGITLHMA